MVATPRADPTWITALRRYLLAAFGLHLGWEVLQLPLYTIWAEPVPSQAFAVLHCTLGDLMIAGISMLAGLTLVAAPDWPRSGSGSLWTLLLVIGVGYTIYSEWMNVNVRGNWAYAPEMPTLPGIGTGLSPLLQWVVVPTLSLWFAFGAVPWRSASPAP